MKPNTNSQMSIANPHLDTLVRKWAPVLDAQTDNSAPVRGTRLRQNTAVMLENQHRALVEAGYVSPRMLSENNFINGVNGNGVMSNYDNNGVGGTTFGALPAATDRGGVGIGSHYSTTGKPSHPNDFYAPGDARVPQTLLPMVRRVFPELLANELFSVQPMSSPVGLVFGLRYKYDADPLSCLGPNDSHCPSEATLSAQQNASAAWWGPDGDEAGYQLLNTRHTGTSAAGMTGLPGVFDMADSDKGVAALLSYFEFSNKISGMTLEIEKTAVEAGTRRIATKWSLELEQDLKAMHNIDIDSEMVAGMSYELQAEIDRELLMRAIQVCLNGTSGKHYSTWKPYLADGRWMAEKNVVLYAKIIREAQLIGVRNRQGAANWLVVTPTVASMLQLLPQFRNFELSASIDPKVGNSRLGTLGNFRVYVDTRTEGQYQEGFRGSNRVDYVLMGYLGAKAGESGIVFAPYIPAMIQRTTGVNDFSPRLGMITRYGVVDHLFGSANFYHMIVIKDLDTTPSAACNSTLSCAPTYYQ